MVAVEGLLCRAEVAGLGAPTFVAINTGDLAGFKLVLEGDDGRLTTGVREEGFTDLAVVLAREGDAGRVAAFAGMKEVEPATFALGAEGAVERIAIL